MKKYSDKFLNQLHKTKNAVVGIEFEFYMKDLSYYKTLEILNQILSPVRVWGFRQYHSDFKTDSKNFKIEPDLSGGSNMVELITGPLEYFEAKYYLLKILKFINTHGYTNDKCSIHFNVSFKDLDLKNINILKLLLDVDEDEIYRYYPTRKDNIYAKSIMNIIPIKEYDFYNTSISIVKNNLKTPKDKYYGVNIKNILEDKETQRVEYRYIGGRDYEKNIGNIIYFMDKFIVNSYNSIVEPLNDMDALKLENHLKGQINNIKSIKRYDDFLTLIPKVVIQINQDNTYDLVKSFYEKIYDKIVDFVNPELDCIINYVTTTNKIEVINLNTEFNVNINNIDLINCQVSGIFNKCHFVNCDVDNSMIKTSKANNSRISGSKIFNSKIETSTIKESYFVDGYLNSEFLSGIWRSGKVGPHGYISPEVKIISKSDNFFFKKFDEEDAPKEDFNKKKGDF